MSYSRKINSDAVRVLNGSRPEPTGERRGGVVEISGGKVEMVDRGHKNHGQTINSHFEMRNLPLTTRYQAVGAGGTASIALGEFSSYSIRAAGGALTLQVEKTPGIPANQKTPQGNSRQRDWIAFVEIYYAQSTALTLANGIITGRSGYTLTGDTTAGYMLNPLVNELTTTPRAAGSTDLFLIKYSERTGQAILTPLLLGGLGGNDPATEDPDATIPDDPIEPDNDVELPEQPYTDENGDPLLSVDPPVTIGAVLALHSGAVSLSLDGGSSWKKYVGTPATPTGVSAMQNGYFIVSQDGITYSPDLTNWRTITPSEKEDAVALTNGDFESGTLDGWTGQASLAPAVLNTAQPPQLPGSTHYIGTDIGKGAAGFEISQSVVLSGIDPGEVIAAQVDAFVLPGSFAKIQIKNGVSSTPSVPVFPPPLAPVLLNAGGAGGLDKEYNIPEAMTVGGVAFDFRIKCVATSDARNSWELSSVGGMIVNTTKPLSGSDTDWNFANISFEFQPYYAGTTTPADISFSFGITNMYDDRRNLRWGVEPLQGVTASIADDGRILYQAPYYYGTRAYSDSRLAVLTLTHTAGTPAARLRYAIPDNDYPADYRLTDNVAAAGVPDELLAELIISPTGTWKTQTLTIPSPPPQISFILSGTGSGAYLDNARITGFKPASVNCVATDRANSLHAVGTGQSILFYDNTGTLKKTVPTPHAVGQIALDGNNILIVGTDAPSSVSFSTDAGATWATYEGLNTITAAFLEGGKGLTVADTGAVEIFTASGATAPGSLPEPDGTLTRDARRGLWLFTSKTGELQTTADFITWTAAGAQPANAAVLNRRTLPLDVGRYIGFPNGMKDLFFKDGETWSLGRALTAPIVKMIEIK